MTEELFTLTFIDREVHFFGPSDYDEDRFRELVKSQLEQCGMSAYEEEVRNAQVRGVPHFITWRDVEKHLPALLANHGFRIIAERWASVSLYPFMHETGATSVLGRAKDLINNYNTAAKQQYKKSGDT